MTMRRSPRRPLILKRRKLPFQQNDSLPAKLQSRPNLSEPKQEPSKSPACQSFPDGIRILDHPSMSDTQVVVIPKTADLRSVIGALTAKGKERGAQGPNKFILLSGSQDSECFHQFTTEEVDISTRTAVGHPLKPDSTHTALTGIKPLNKDLDCGPLDDSLTSIHWLDRVSPFKPDPDQLSANKENQTSNSQNFQTNQTQNDIEAILKRPLSERPPFSYMAMIQFAINSQRNRRMTLKEIYTWIEDHFPYFREVAKPGWKNSIRHNLSLHDMFIRETSPDGKISFWTIRPEANRCLTLDQVYKPGSDPMTAPVPVPMLLLPHQQQKKLLPDAVITPTASEKKMKPLLPRTDSYLIPIQLPVASSVYLPSSSSAQLLSSRSKQKQNHSRGVKRVRIAPKVTHSEAPPQRSKEIKVEVKEEPVCIPVTSGTPKALSTRQSSGSRRKQSLVQSLHEEPLLLCPDNSFLDSGVVSDASTSQERQDTELGEQHSPDREFSFKTPIKSSSLTSSTPRKPPSNLFPEPWKVTPVGKGSQIIPDVSPIRTPGGPAVTPQHDFPNFSFSSTPFKDWALFSSPKEPLASRQNTGSPTEGPRSSCSRELLQAAGSPPTNRSITEGLVLDTMNDSLSKILVDISFSGLDEEDLGMGNISWSEFFPQLK